MTGNIYVDSYGSVLSEKEEMLLKCIYDNCDKDGKNADATLVCDEFCKIYEREYAQTTYITFLSRIEKKGYIERYHIGRKMFINVKIPKSEYVKIPLGYALGFLCNGDITKLLAYYMASKSPEERKQKKQAILDLLKEQEKA